MAISLISPVTIGQTPNGAEFDLAAVDTTGAPLLIVVVGCSDGAATTPTDDLGLTWNALTGITGTFGQVKMWWASNPTGHASHVVRCESFFATQALLRYTGNHASPFDQQNQAKSEPGTGRSINIVPTVDGCALVTGCASNEVTEVDAITQGFTILAEIAGVDTVAIGLAVAHLIQGTAASITPQWQFSERNAYAMIASFKPEAAAAGAAPTPPQHWRSPFGAGDPRAGRSARSRRPQRRVA